MYGMKFFKIVKHWSGVGRQKTAENHLACILPIFGLQSNSKIEVY